MGLKVNDDRLAARVGGAVIALVIVAATLVLGAKGLHLRAQLHFQVYFEEPGALTAGSDVQVAGKVIGEVESIRLVSRRQAAAPDHPLHPDGGIVADVRIEKRYAYMAPRHADYFVNVKGIFGERYLEIGAPMGRDGYKNVGPAGLEQHIAEGDRIRGIDPPSMDRVLLRSYSNLVTSRIFLKQVEPHWRRLVRELNDLSQTLDEIEPEPGAYGRLGDSLGALTDRVEESRARWAVEEISLEDLGDLSDRAGRTLDSIERTVDDLEQRLDLVTANIDRLRAAAPKDFLARFDRAAKQARGALDKLRDIETKARELAAIVERGEGTIGGLLHDPEFSDDAKQIGKIIKRQPWRVIGHPQDH